MAFLSALVAGRKASVPPFKRNDEMKRVLMLTLAAGGLLLATSSEAQAQSWNRGRSNGFGVSLNFGSPQRYTTQRSYRNIGVGLNTGYRSLGHSYHSGYNSRYIAPRQSYRYTPSRYGNQSSYYGGSHRYIPQQSYGYGGRRRCGY